MNQTLHLLQVEDSERDAALIQRHLRKAGYKLIHDRVDTPEAMRAALKSNTWDLVLCDYSMPRFNALSAVALMKELQLDIPFIIISGTIGEAAAVEGMRAGADDYLMKDKLARLVPAVDRELKEAENRRARRVAEAQLFLNGIALDAAANAIIITDRAGSIQWVNRAFTEASGYSLAEALGQTPRILNSGKQPSAFYDEMWSTILSGRVWRNSLVNRRKDGELTEEDLTITPIKDAAGNITHFIGIKQDITELKRAEEALRRSEARLTEAQRIGQMASWEFDLASRTYSVSPTLYRLFHLDPTLPLPTFSSLRGTVFTNKAWEMVHQAAQRALAQGTSYDLTVEVKRPDGAELCVTIRAEAVRNEVAITGLLGTIQDVTASKEVERSLRETREQLRLFVEHAPAAIAMLDHDMRYIAASNRWLSDYDIADQEIIGRSHYEVFPDITEDWKEIHRRCMSGAVERKDADSWSRSDGQVEWVRWEVRPWRTDDGGIGGLIIFSEVITERRRSEEALQVKNEELSTMTQQLWQASKLATMGELAASIAHELNNPLATVALRTESLLMEMPEDSEKRRPLEIIAKEVDRMANLVNNLLQFSRRGHRQVSTVEPTEEIVNSTEFIHYHLRNRNIRIVKDFSDSLPTIQADRQQLRQLFLNLITNASDAMPQGGDLTVRARSASLNNHEAVELEFSDTGEGIEPEHLASVWEPFFTTKPEGKGTGLGLAICRRIVEEHGGTIGITSRHRHGTSVRMVLPATNSGKILSSLNNATSASSDLKRN